MYIDLTDEQKIELIKIIKNGSKSKIKKCLQKFGINYLETLEGKLHKILK